MKSTTSKEFATRYRVMTKKNQGELSKSLKLTQSFISKLERGTAELSAKSFVHYYQGALSSKNKRLITLTNKYFKTIIGWAPATAVVAVTKVVRKKRTKKATVAGEVLHAVKAKKTRPATAAVTV